MFILSPALYEPAALVVVTLVTPGTNVSIGCANSLLSTTDKFPARSVKLPDTILTVANRSVRFAVGVKIAVLTDEPTPPVKVPKVPAVPGVSIKSASAIEPFAGSSLKVAVMVAV